MEAMWILLVGVPTGDSWLLGAGEGITLLGFSLRFSVIIVSIFRWLLWAVSRLLEFSAHVVAGFVAGLLNPALVPVATGVVSLVRKYVSGAVLRMFVIELSNLLGRVRFLLIQYVAFLLGIL